MRGHICLERAGVNDEMCPRVGRDFRWECLRVTHEPSQALDFAARCAR